MSKILPILFVLILGSVGVGMDYYLFLQKGKVLGALGEDQSGSYFNHITQRLQVSADGVTKTSQSSLETAMPTVISGWDIHRFGAEDLGIIAGRAPTPEETEQFANTRNGEALGLALTPGAHVADLALYKGDTSVRLVATLIVDNGSMATGALMAQNKFLNGMNQMQDPDQSGPRDFAVVDGITITELPQDTDSVTGNRIFRATLGEAVTVTAVTRSKDDLAIKEVWDAVDFVMLNSLIENPLSDVTDSAVMLSPDEADETQVAEAASATAPPAKAEAKGTPKIISKGCVRRAGKLDCPKN